jgi:hypothetical protein
MWRDNGIYQEEESEELSPCQDGRTRHKRLDLGGRTENRGEDPEPVDAGAIVIHESSEDVVDAVMKETDPQVGIDGSPLKEQDKKRMRKAGGIETVNPNDISAGPSAGYCREQ